VQNRLPKLHGKMGTEKVLPTECYHQARNSRFVKARKSTRFRGKRVKKKETCKNRLPARFVAVQDRVYRFKFQKEWDDRVGFCQLGRRNKPGTKKASFLLKDGCRCCSLGGLEGSDGHCMNKIVMGVLEGGKSHSTIYERNLFKRDNASGFVRRYR